MASIKIDKAIAQQSIDTIGKLKYIEPEIPLNFRLEVDPRGDSYDEALAARVADPLWMLSRQWQFREFAGEDAGTPVDVTYRLNGTPVLGYAPGLDPTDADFAAFTAGDVPLEARVEAEPLLASGAHPKANIEAGQVLRRYCANAGRDDIAQAAQQAYPGTLDMPPDPLSDVAGMLWHLLLDGNGIDAIALATDLRASRKPDGTLAALPAALSAAGLAMDAAPVLQQWLRWMDDYIVEPDANPAWQSNRFEYAFELAAGANKQRVRLDAQEYVDGRIDWHDFDTRAGRGGRRGILPDVDARPLDDPKPRSSIANPIQYGGMPAMRFWEFEDGQVNFARLQAGPLDLVRMMVAEYALVHGNDWFLVPARVRAGGLYRVRDMQVRDTFGRVTQVAPVANEPDSRWRLHGLVDLGSGDADGSVLFVPPPLSDTLEGDALEEVALVRDEMANLAWAIETRVQGTSGEPLDRRLEDQRYSLGQQPNVPSTDANLVYRLMTPVPSHWLPLIPVRRPGSLSLDIQLQRAGMKRFYRIDAAAMAAIDGYAEFIDRLRNSPEFVTALPVDPNNPDIQVFVFHPRGLLLRADPTLDITADSLFIEEEEVPRAGIHVERRFNYARTADGRAWLWCGRRKRVGRGEASSGLRFDIGVAPGQR
ncbi:MAG: hypothetical protein H6959_00700 [Chromatiaceae bacterium]|nr:hypothetical protein [Gammaproteobacteria bacterium]MCP5301117.1 hypothetical protein [Chromatiaceae bacterium]MCP5421411.1 hypothetical protein [Chromatiaceae bacterium]